MTCLVQNIARSHVVKAIQNNVGSLQQPSRIVSFKLCNHRFKTDIAVYRLQVVCCSFRLSYTRSNVRLGEENLAVEVFNSGRVRIYQAQSAYAGPCQQISTCTPQGADPHDNRS